MAEAENQDLTCPSRPLPPFYDHLLLSIYYRIEQTDLVLASGPMNLVLPQSQFHSAITG